MAEPGLVFSYFLRGSDIHISIYDVNEFEQSRIYSKIVNTKISTVRAKCDKKVSKAIKIPFCCRGPENSKIRPLISKVYSIENHLEVADKVIPCINNAISSIQNKNIVNVIYSTGPSSFTTIRIINAIAKGIAIVNPSVKIVGVSSFLTYLSIVAREATRGLLAIATKRGDYFTCEYTNNILIKQQILDNESIKKYDGNVFLEECPIFDAVNLADCQKYVLTSVISTQNTDFICTGLKTAYAYTPEYKF